VSEHDLKSLHRGEEYRQSRPLYPSSLFDPIKASLEICSRSEPARFLDLGAGTGYAIESLLRVMPRLQVMLLEPDLGMLKQARLLHPDAKWLHSTSDQIALADASVDGVLVGSAWHWMNYESTTLELERVLVTNGLVYVFEYQFPKAKDFLELNEWVRRQFNLYWKAPSQIPRGSLFEITGSLRQSRDLSQSARVSVNEIREHTAEEFAQMIFSQSRYLHFEESLPEKDREIYRLKIRHELSHYWRTRETLPFLYAYEGFIFRKRP
jgi:ubiquinone/menaquinone biosynthesis C-methylase UbiE